MLCHCLKLDGMTSDNTLLRTSVNVGSSSQLEVHSNSWLSDLQLGQATQILQKEENSSVQLLSQVFNNIPDLSQAQAAHCILALTKGVNTGGIKLQFLCCLQLSAVTQRVFFGD